MKIATKLTLILLGVSIFPLVIVSVFAFINGRDALELSTIDRLEAITTLKEAEFDRWIESNVDFLRYISQMQMVKTQIEKLVTLDPNSSEFQGAHAQLLDGNILPILNYWEGFEDLAIIRAEDGLVLLSNDPDLENKYRESEPYFLEGRRAMYVDDAIYSMSHQKIVMHIATPIRNSDEEPIAVLVGHLNFQEMSDIMLKQATLSQSEETYLVNTFNFFVTDSRFEPGSALTMTNYSSGVNACLDKTNGVGFYEDYRGVQVVGVFHWLPENHMCIITEVDLAEAFRSINDLRNAAHLVGIAAAIIMAIAGIFFARNISDPVLKVVAGVEEIGRGNLNIRIDLDRNDEIGNLASAFDDMTAKLSATRLENTKLVEELKIWGQELESRVEERTREVKAAQLATLSMMEDVEEARVKAEEVNQELKAAQIATMNMMMDAEQARQELARSNEELERFAYIASHDLQEPLRMVASYLQLLERRYGEKLDQDAKEFIDFAVDGATRMKRLINDLLAYSRVGTRGMPFKLTDLNNVLGQVHINLQTSIDESGALITKSQMPTVMADETQMIQLFQNLLANAIKFHKDDHIPQIDISVKEIDNAWQFAVCDNGIGIDPQFAERIFVIFQRLHAKDQYSGTGIGLAVSYRIVERHGGRIWVESQPGEGATFYFSIPK